MVNDRVSTLELYVHKFDLRLKFGEKLAGRPDLALKRIYPITEAFSTDLIVEIKLIDPVDLCLDLVLANSERFNLGLFLVKL